MHRGYVKIHRKIIDNPVVFKDSDHLSVWVYLLLNATHKNYQAMFKGRSITLEPGQLITGRLSIAKKLKISESKVKRILFLFKSEQLIDQQPTNQNSLITLVSWSKYQQSDQQSDQRVTSDRPAGDQRVTTNKNVKNVETQKNDNSNEPAKKRKKTSDVVDSEFIAKMTELYDAVDVEAERRKAEAWLLCNPGRKMTRKFFNGWLSRAKPTIKQEDEWEDDYTFGQHPDELAFIIATEDRIAAEKKAEEEKRARDLKGD